ncbi:MAG: DsbA family protein [Candidatus Micrarchaeia archaeon]
MEKKTKKNENKIEHNKEHKEPLLLVKPVKWLGLDTLHILLIVLVLILIGLSFSLSEFKPGPVVLNCPYGINSNYTCINLNSSSSNALLSAERVLASYSLINSSLSLLPYYSLVNEAKISYMPNLNEWYVSIPYLNPFIKNQIFNASIILDASNYSLESFNIQTFKPLYSSQNRVVSLGTISLYGKTECTQKTPIPIYLFVDPYAPGALQSMYDAYNTTLEYGNKVNMSYKFIFTGYALKYYKSAGITETQTVGESLFCASQQQNKFEAFLKNYSILFNDYPLSNTTLTQIAMGSGLNMSNYNLCMQNSTEVLRNQALLSSFYGVETTPTFIVDCKYMTIPQTLNDTLDYVFNSINSK